ncbi:hypothetical protein X274_09155 [Marinitoga sp. 1155]|nr:hypothetical protein X274_09155 [Marinitoga sp. 1155]
MKEIIKMLDKNLKYIKLEIKELCMEDANLKH